MPIGLTASGEIVFPIQCKELIERERDKVVERPAAGSEEKSIVKEPEAVAPVNSKPAEKPEETVALSKRVEHYSRERVMRSDDCTGYRTYDPKSGTYRGYDGRRRSCRER